MIQVAYVACWWLALEIIGLVSFPLASRVCSGLSDRGYSISKLVGLVLLTYFVWMISVLHILPFGIASIAISFLLLVALSLFLGRNNLRIAAWPRRQIVISELLFAASFIILLLIVRGKPDIFFSGANDALFNNAFIQSILRGGYFPPLDPWFSGESVAYYYGEHVLIATLTSITRVPTTIAFNLAVAMFPALSVCASYGLGYNITAKKRYGLLAALFVCVAGYTSGAFQLLAFAFHSNVLGYPPPEATTLTDWLLWFDFFHAHWVIEGAIIHYPYSAFLMGDLHSYSVSPSFQLMFILLIFALFQKGRLSSELSRADTRIDIAVLSLCLGFFFILNTWEYPTYIIFTALAFLLLRIRPSIKGTLAIPAAIIGLSFVLYLPHFITGVMSGFHGLGLVTTRASIGQFLEFGALFLFISCSFLFILAKREILRARKTILLAFFVLLAIVVVAVLIDFQLLVITVPLGLLSLYLIYRSKQQSAREFVLLLLVMSAALAFFCEFIYINDALDVPWERFNTTMKVYLQLWVIFGTASACAVFYVVSSLGRKTKAVWITLVAVLIVASLVHPIAATTARLGGKHTDWGINRGTLDGMAYVKIVDKGDYDAIRWLNEEIPGAPVILEAPWSEGERRSRVSSFTGLPTVLGSRFCETMWGRGWQKLEERDNNAATIYNTLDNDQALELLSKYEVKYIYVGSLEQEAYATEGLRKFARYPDNYSLAYESEGVTIYEVRTE